MRPASLFTAGRTVCWPSRSLTTPVLYFFTVNGKTCPTDHPFPFYHGSLCCKYHLRSEFCSSGPEASMLKSKDNDDCCILDEKVQCQTDSGAVSSCTKHADADSKLIFFHRPTRPQPYKWTLIAESLYSCLLRCL